VLVDLGAVDGAEELEELGAERVGGRVLVVGLGRARHDVVLLEVDLADAGDEGDDLDAVGLLEVLLGDRARGDAADGLAGGGAAAAGGGLDAVLLEVGVVRVRGARVEVRLGVVVRALVLVVDEEADGRAEGDAVLDAGLDVDEILFVTLPSPVCEWEWSRVGECWVAYGSGQVALAGAATAELGLDVGLGEDKALVRDMASEATQLTRRHGAHSPEGSPR
jgi:hypothetical protein